MSNTKPMFSVIIPTYHEESSIDNTLSSIHNATNGHATETIIVDAGSKDRTTYIASQYTDNIHVLNERGISLARNHGARKSRGDILIFLDSDTQVPINFFDELNDVFSNPLIAGANCNVMPCSTTSPKKGERMFYNTWSHARNIFYRIRPCGTGDNGIIVRRKTFEKAGGFDEDMNTMEDLDFMFRAARHGRFLFLKNLTLTESIRRVRHTGILKFSTIYLFNFFYYLAKGRPRINRWKTVR